MVQIIESHKTKIVWAVKGVTEKALQISKLSLSLLQGCQVVAPRLFSLWQRKLTVLVIEDPYCGHGGSITVLLPTTTTVAGSAYPCFDHYCKLWCVCVCAHANWCSWYTSNDRTGQRKVETQSQVLIADSRIPPWPPPWLLDLLILSLNICPTDYNGA